MLNVHIQVYVTPKGEEAARRAAIVKAIDNTGALALAKPSAIKIHRHYFKPWEQEYGSDPYQRGHWCAEVVIASLGGYVDPRLILEPFNEAGYNLPFLKGFVERCHERGYLAGGPCLGTGNLEPDQVKELVEADWCGLDALLLHGYWGAQGFTDWHACRHRKIAEWSGGYYPPVIYTEGGRDAIEGGQAGWVKSGLSVSRYRAECLAYRDTLYRDRQTGYKVMGSTLFTFGPNKDWYNFDMEQFADVIPDAEPEWELIEAWRNRQRGGGTNVGADERMRYALDIWHRAGVPANPGSALFKAWYDAYNRGNYWGRPEEPEHPSESGRYVVQAFSSQIAYYDTKTGSVAVGLPPF